MKELQLTAHPHISLPLEGAHFCEAVPVDENTINTGFTVYMCCLAKSASPLTLKLFVFLPPDLTNWNVLDSVTHCILIPFTLCIGLRGQSHKQVVMSMVYFIS
jgi:hypothetical protein